MYRKATAGPSASCLAISKVFCSSSSCLTTQLVSPSFKASSAGILSDKK
jgi:hypothetical protein